MSKDIQNILVDDPKKMDRLQRTVFTRAVRTFIDKSFDCKPRRLGDGKLEIKFSSGEVYEINIVKTKRSHDAQETVK